MHFTKYAGLATALFGASAFCDVWAQFCNDNACQDSCGKSVDVTNAGCLNEVGRNSILFHNSDGSDGTAYGLNFYNGGGCDGLVQCDSGLVLSSGCVDLNGNPFADSFQFVPVC